MGAGYGMTRTMRKLFPFVFVLAACGGAGPYGHSPKYAPLGEEEKALAGTTEYDPVMYGRQQEEWRKKTVAAFGVVTNRGTGQGTAYVTMSVRRLEPRNLCDNANDEDSCRVTVSDAEFGVVHLMVPLSAEDDVGEHSVGVGSLMRIVGTIGEDVDPNDASPVLRVKYYRHWPRGYYVTKAAAATMRQ
jgi:hypothetical protein